MDPIAAREESLRGFQHDVDSRVRAHEQDGRDPTWARPAAATLKSDLGAVHGGAFKVLDTDCRMTTCVATLEWPDRASATADFKRVLHAKTELNCEVKVSFGDRQNTARPFSTKVFYDCADSRASGNDPDN